MSSKEEEIGQSTARKITVRSRSKTKRINLTIDKDFEVILSNMHGKYPLLKDIDIIRMAVSGYYADHKEDFEKKLSTTPSDVVSLNSSD